MRTITLHRWYVQQLDGKRRPTRHLMTAADALASDPAATPVPGTQEVRQVPDCVITCGGAHLAPAQGQRPAGVDCASSSSLRALPAELPK